METYSMFQQPWWLDATAPGRWDAVEIERGGELMAWLPFVVTKWRGTRVLTMPQLTQSLGPWIKNTGAGYTKTLNREMELYGELIARLPKHDSFKQNFAPEITNWLPFYWRDFSQTTRYTYTIDLSQPLEAIHSQMDKRNRSRLRRAEQELLVTHSSTEYLEDVLEMSRLTFERQGLGVPYPEDLLYSIDEAVQRSGAHRWVVKATDADGRLHSAVYVVGDSQRTYALVSGADPEVRSSGASVLTRWKSIMLAQEVSSIYDFEGSMLRGVEHRNRKYGAKQTPYFAVERVLNERRARTAFYSFAAAGARVVAKGRSAARRLARP